MSKSWLRLAHLMYEHVSKMNKYILYSFLLVLLSCSNDREASELAFKRDAIKRSISYNEQQLDEIIKLSEPGRRPDSLIKNQSNEIISWRRNFIDNPTTENLLLYADSVEARYNRFSGLDKDEIYNIRLSRDQLKETNDSLSFYNLLYYSSVAEGSLLKTLALQFGATTYPYWHYYPLYFDKKEYKLHDSVIVTFTPCHECLSDATLDFSQVTCINQEKDSSLKPKIIKSGPNYILIYNPDKTGTYKITGSVKLKQAGNYDTELGIINEFKVSS